MQNGAFGWASSLSSSLAAQKVSWTGVSGYQASLTDLFLKKPFGSGISQLAAASSYLEKMSDDHHHSNQSPQQHPNNTSNHPSNQHLLHPKCNHIESKGGKFPCEVCHPEYSTLFPSKSSLSFSDHHPPDKNNMSLPTTSAPASHHNPHHHSHHHMPPPAPVGLVLQQQPVSGVLLQPPPSSSSSSRRNSSSTNRVKNNGQPIKHFLCPVCHRSFTQKGNLKTHMMIHSGDKPYACQICGKSFTQKGNVDTHMKIHTGEKDFNCRSCGKGFTQRGNLRTHERSVHTKEKPFACDVCGKSFSQKGNMQTHIRTHNKDDRFPCNLCGKTFSQKGNLKTHMQRHSGTLPARKYGPRKKGSAARAAAAQFAASNESPREGRAHLKSTDDESSSVEHSLDNAVQQNLLSPSSVEASQAALKHQREHQETGNQSTSHQSSHHHHSHQSHVNHSQNRSPVAPIAVPFNSRFYTSPSSSISAPLAAHTASWLAASGAASIASKGRAVGHYDSILTSYAGFGQHPQHLTRLTFLSGQQPIDHQDKRDSHSSQQQDYNQSQGQPNPDFSQLLD